MRTFVILGIVLLVVTIAGARWVSTHQTPDPNAAKIEAGIGDPKDILAIGYFDVEQGVAGLYPKQFGDIVSLKSEGTQVKAGEVLLQVDDSIAKLDVKRAENDVVVSVNQLKEAKKLPELYVLQRAQQKAQIDSTELEIKKTQRERDIRLSAFGADNNELKKNTTQMFEFGLGQLEEKKKSEQAKLKQIELQDAQLKIDQVQAELDAKKTRVEQAKQMLKHYQVVAPSDGTVLRVYVKKGETLGPNPRVQAIDFLPDAPIVVRAEVLQEWGRLVKTGQVVTIEDDTYNGPIWTGKVKSISRWYAPIRNPVIEPFRFNDVRTLECIIDVEDGGNQKFIGQRVRAKIKI